MNLTANFKQEEFECKCGCGLKEISPSVVLVWQMVRDHFGKPVTITSGCRCNTHNQAVGGTEYSQHKKKGDGLTHAADGKVKDVTPRDVYDYINSVFPNSLGLGLYDTFVHIDDRMDRAYRWGNK